MEMRDNPNVDYCMYCGEIVEGWHSFKASRDHIWHTACMASEKDAVTISDLRTQLATARAKAEALDHIAEMVGEKDDPFAAWEVVDHLKRQSEKAATARADALREAAEWLDRLTSDDVAYDRQERDLLRSQARSLLALIDKEPSNGS